MDSITEAILTYLQAALQTSLVTNVTGTSIAGAVKVGSLQGEPDVDEARISVEIFTNDPTAPGEWIDEIVEWEMPRSAIWARRFTIMYRTLLVETGEDLQASYAIAGVIKARIEQTLNGISWAGITVPGEEVMGCPIQEMESELSQGGGPGEYDWSGKIGFDVWTRAGYS